ncbi:MAG: J domain-containing protein [Notoacmeibacter sp.]|nr:J domain-containing protein [Notoacmeibacter sp.]
MTRDPYDVLGVGKTAPAKDIKAAFRKLAKKWHPDQNKDDPKAKERFAEVSQAYDIVGDDEKRKQFDRGEIDAEGKPRFADFGGGDPFGGANPFGQGGFRQRGGPGGAHFEFRSGGPGGPGGFDAGDIFSDIFGQAFSQGGQQRGQPRGRARQPQRGEDLRATLEVTLEDVATAAKVSVQMPDGRKLAIKLPEQVEDGKVIRLKGQGGQVPFGEAGDALITVKLRPHPQFRVEGSDIHADLPVSLKDAVLGTKAPVQTLTGRVAVTVPAWSSSDKVLRIKGKGLAKKGGGHGDLLVHVRIMLPEDGDAALEEFLRDGVTKPA